jgi:hypothetical protein
MAIINKGSIEKYIIFELLNYLTVIVACRKQMTVLSKLLNIFDNVFNDFLKRTHVKVLIFPQFPVFFCLICIFHSFLKIFLLQIDIVFVSKLFIITFIVLIRPSLKLIHNV